MPKVAFSAVLHQPFRIRRYSFLEIGSHRDYFDEPLNRRIFERVARKCYIPALKILIDLAARYEDFKINLSLTGTFLEQAALYEPLVIELLKELYNFGALELIAETYYHSLAFLVGLEEFKEEVKLHLRALKEIFGGKARPKIFRNTEAMYSNEVAKAAWKLGFKGVVTEGHEKILGWRSPGWPYLAKSTKIALLLRNYRLSDDIAFRFSARGWEEWPLTADKYALWLSKVPDPWVIIFVDFETFGEHHWPESGILEFLKHLPAETAKHSNLSWSFLSELAEEALKNPVDEIDVPFFISWADQDRDLSAWLGNKLQDTAFEAVKSLEAPVKERGDEELLATWRKLLTSDHFYYMTLKYGGDEEVHSYFRGEVYSNAYEAFASYMNILADLRMLLKW